MNTTTTICTKNLLTNYTVVNDNEYTKCIQRTMWDDEDVLLCRAFFTSTLTADVDDQILHLPRAQLNIRLCKTHTSDPCTSMYTPPIRCALQEPVRREIYSFQLYVLQKLTNV